MTKRMLVLGVVFLALATFPASGSAAKANPDDVPVDQFFSAIRDGNFKAATQHFSTRMKALSPPGLKGSWDSVYGQVAPLLSWKILKRRNLPRDQDEVSVQLRFRNAIANSIIVVNSKTGEITSVLFKQPTSRAASN